MVKVEKFITNTINNRLIFLCLTLFYIIFAFFTNEFILNKSFYLNSFNGVMNIDQVNRLMVFKERWNWIGYFFVPLTLFIKFLFTAICLKIGVLLSEQKVPFSNLFRLAMLAEIAFVIGLIIQMIIILDGTSIRSVTELENFAPLSILSFLNHESIKKLQIFPLRNLNIFELLYWVLLAFGIKVIMNFKFWKSILFVLKTYVIGFLILSLLITYFKLATT